MIPDSILSQLTENHDLNILNRQPVSGGSINRAFKLTTDRGYFFLKWNPSPPGQFFEKEARGLELLKSAKTGIRIPEVSAFGDGGGHNPGFLLMEWIDEGTGSADHSFRFGQELASLHQTHSDAFGLDYDNYIGRLPQKNSSHTEWISFFVEERVDLQLKHAINSGAIDKKYLANWDRLAGRLPEIFPGCKPSLLHGDLWGENYLFDGTGTAVLIDPAVYYGHPEMDLSFTKMFGGFSAEFYKGYESISPVAPGFSSRVEIYNYYPLLVHVNLFGGGYARQAESFLKRY